MAEWSMRSDGVYQRFLSALERVTRRNTRTSVHESSTQTKRGERVEKFEVVDDFEDTPSVATAGSCPWSTQAESLARSQRNLDEFGAVHIPRIHLARPILIKYPTGSYRHRCVDGCCSETQDWDRKNVQQYCQPRTETQASAKYPRCCDHSRAMLTWPCMIDVERV